MENLSGTALTNEQAAHCAEPRPWLRLLGRGRSTLQAVPTSPPLLPTPRMKFNSSGVGRLRSTSDRAGSRRDPARAVDASSSKPDVTPHTSATAADATADDATAATVAAEIAATPMPSFLDSIESHFLALSQGSPEVLDAMFRSLSGDVPPAPRGSPRALLYSDAIAYAIVRKQVAFSDGLNAAVRAYLDRTETELRAEGLLSTPLTQDESAVAYGNIARSTPLRRPRPESPSPPARDPKRPCQDATIPSFPEPLSQRDPRLRRRLALPVPEPAAPPAPAPRAAPVAPAAALAAPIAAPAVRSAHTPSAAPTSSAEPATTIDAPRSFAQLAAAPAAGRRPASPLPQTSTATTAAAAATPRYPPLIVEVLPEWTTHFRALRDRLGHAPNARPFGRGVRFSPKYGEEYRTVQRYLTELEKNQKRPARIDGLRTGHPPRALECERGSRRPLARPAEEDPLGGHLLRDGALRANV
ncbi:unnamed protein product [Leptosia nina]|uniref:Uncharacterized protein n=1 Tax=Leptosia nina TaxID=320188 RepID=A0AAV1JQS2_9NEOP